MVARNLFQEPPSPMDLRDKLERLGVRKGAQHLVPRPAVELRPHGIERVLPGQIVENESGAFYLTEETYLPGYRHGDWPLAALLEQPAAHVLPLAKDESLAGLDFREAVFIDTETTGLAGGTGTYAFLVGVGYFQGDSFTLAQFFLRDFDDEPAMLEELAGLLDRHSALVSFNGRAFDWPLLETRYILARRPAPLAGAPHLDLLHLARRLWRVRLASCSLSSLEQNILGVQRDGDDVPGWMVPQLYFDYLQSGDARPLTQVFYHNAQDILSLVTLAAYLGQIGADPLGQCLLQGEDLYSLGRFLERSGEPEEALRIYEKSLTCPLSLEVQHGVALQLSLLYKRLGQMEQAVQLWSSALGQGQLYPYVELAKYYEHQAKDYRQAQDCVRQAMELVQQAGYGNRWERQRDLQELQRRLQRLERKLGG